MTERVENITLNSRYRVCFEQAASANKIDGFKIESNGDDLEVTISKATLLYLAAKDIVEANKPVQPSIKLAELKKWVDNQVEQEPCGPPF